MFVDTYLKDVQKRFATGIAREHAYRPALQNLIESILPRVTATNDPARIECGAPDFILTQNNIDVGYIEAKDVGIDLDKIEKDEQLKRYLESLDNLILTDYLEFRFFLHGEKVEQIKIAEIENGKIRPLPHFYDRFSTLILDFAAFQGQTIKSSKRLAQLMARKASLMKDVFYKTVSGDKDSSLKDQLATFKKVLVHDMDEAQFADVYAQTIAYGLFTARLNDETLEGFSRAEAYELVPRSNPFLRQLFHYVAGPELDDRVIWIVDALCEVFRATDLREILKDFGTYTGKNDPILHFYETFLAEYDTKLRKARGVWYTPEPVVNFIVRAVDDILKSHFGLKDGLADNSKIKIEIESQEKDKRSKTGRKKEEIEVHKVQVLDVATGTGTFLAEVVKQVYARFEGQQGVWSSYVEEDLLPRLHGFELLMASYAMCHMKLDLLLQETGYRPKNPKAPPRLSVYLTNSLEEHHPDSGSLLATWLSKEANEASRIKRDMPIMVAIGNPPYSGHSKNKGEWIEGLLDAYKKEPGGGKLQERNSKWLNNDYVKFIRLGENFIEKNGEGILSFITSNSYLDSPTFRGMRWHLLNTFDEIYILDLHGNSNKKEVCPDGGKDKNVFDITEGVAIVVLVKNKSSLGKNKLATVYHFDLWGERQHKYEFLETETVGKINWQKLKVAEKDFFFVPRNYGLLKEFKKGFPLNELFQVNSVGIVTARDSLTIHKNRGDLITTLQQFSELDPEEARSRFNLGEDVRDWKVNLAQEDLRKANLNLDNLAVIDYRPFDSRWTYYTGQSRGFQCMPRPAVMNNIINKENISLLFMRQYSFQVPNYCYAFCSKNLVESRIFVSHKGIANVAPLYTYQTDFGDVETKSPNLDPVIYGEIKEIVPKVTPETLFDYIYGVLHSPVYRKRYSEFLKSDFPRIPYPKDVKIFNRLAKLGGELRELHLMESSKLDKLMTKYPVEGDHLVEKSRHEKGKVWINPTQYFAGVPDVAWEFYIGGYQPAQKWLKDRKGRNLSSDDLLHYQRIIKTLYETDRLMDRIGKVDFLPK